MKPTFRQSEFQHYFACPYRMKLSREVQRETTDEMREGLLFEGYVFNHFKNDNEKTLIGRKKPKTIRAIKDFAETVREQLIPTAEDNGTVLAYGEPFVKLRHKTDKWILTGELDYLGDVIIKNEIHRGILDLKFTADIPQAWGNRNKKAEFIQSVTYQYLVWRTKGELLPFYYALVENKYNTPIVKTVEVHSTLEDFEWLEETLDNIAEDEFLPPNVGWDTCIGKRNARCPYFGSCLHAQNWLSQHTEVYFGGLLNPGEEVEFQ